MPSQSRLNLARLLGAASTCALALASCAPRDTPKTSQNTAPTARQSAAAQPDSGAEKDALGFQLARAPYTFSFPFDHGAHRDYLTEWWYYTGHLRAKSGRSFDYQLTFFRQALAPHIPMRKSKWATRDIVFAHFALTDETGKRFFFSDRISRAAAGLAGAETEKARIWLGDWAMQINPQSQFLRAASRDDNSISQNADASTRSAKDAAFYALDLTQVPLKKPTIQGENGVSQKSAGRGRASHYYSFTRLQTRGSVTIGNETFSVTGESWFDHEFGSNQLAKNQVGWDWFSLQLSDGREVMLYQLRRRDGSVDPFSSGTLVEKNGRATHLKIGDFSIAPLATWHSAASGATYPARWRVRVPRAKISFEVAPTIANQELRTQRAARITYWEGSVRVLAKGAEIGRGYVELTGYDKAFSGTF